MLKASCGCMPHGCQAWDQPVCHACYLPNVLSTVHCTCMLHKWRAAPAQSMQVRVGVVWQVDLPADEAIVRLAGDQRWLPQASVAPRHAG